MFKGKPMLMTRGENNSNWRGGITGRRIEYILWREAVFMKDDYKITFGKDMNKNNKWAFKLGYVD